MPESTDPSQSADDAESSTKPRPVSSRHFRQSGETTDPRDAPELPAEEESRVRRRPMPRSGNVNMSVMVGEPHSADPSPRFESPDAPTLTLPVGLAALAWKLAAVAIVMFGLGYFIAPLTRPSAPAPTGNPAAPEPPSTWRAASLETLNRAIAADRSGDLQTASALLTELAGNEPRLPGLVRYLADLQVRQQNYLAAETALLAQVESGREVAPSYYLRAFNAARQRHFDDALRYLQSSLAEDPLSADTLYQMAELQRRQGKLPDAIEYDRQALLRIRPGVGIPPATVALKLRLAQIEAGQAPEVEAGLAEARKSSPLAADWLFTAAALSLQKGDLAPAAESLAKAREMMPRDEFNAWIEDYFFRPHTDKPALAGLRPTDEERRRRSHSSWEFSLDP
jgi:tetratricopeptide (TPR) repeat protein